MTYVLLSLAFLAVAAIVLFLALATAPDRRDLLRRWAAPVAVAGVALLVLTAVFDNLMIAAGLVTYANATLSGVRVGSVPIEDFAYPLAGLLLLPALWLLLRPKGDRA